MEREKVMKGKRVEKTRKIIFSYLGGIEKRAEEWRESRPAFCDSCLRIEGCQRLVFNERIYMGVKAGRGCPDFRNVWEEV